MNWDTALRVALKRFNARVRRSIAKSQNFFDGGCSDEHRATYVGWGVTT